MRLRKELYRPAWKALKKRYFLNVVIIFVVGIILHDGYNYVSGWGQDGIRGLSYIIGEDRKSNTEILEDFLRHQEIIELSGLMESPVTTRASELPIAGFIASQEELESHPAPPADGDENARRYTKGLFSVFVNEMTSSGSLGFGLLNGFNKLIFHERIGESVTIFIMTVILALIWIFVKNPILIGRCRYFMEHRLYGETSADRLLFIFKTGMVRHTAFIMLLKSVRQTLWNLTVIGGVIKHYEYLMIPYVLAEDPTITYREAFARSKRLMEGEKLNAFLIDLSLFPSVLLDGVTFHISSLFFFNIFRECIFAEFSSALRLEKCMIYDIHLCENKTGLQRYPDEMSRAPYMEKFRGLSTDYNKSYGGDMPVIFFFFFSFIGWAWEVLFYLMNEGRFINRGTMMGPWLPIYGLAGWIIIYLLRPLRKKPALMFFGTVAVCGGMEYMTSWLLELIFKTRWWDYAGYFLNLHGRICLEGLLVFGLAGVTMTYFIAPVADNVFRRIPRRARKIIFTVLIILFFADLGYSALNPNMGNGITEGFH